MGHGTTGPGPFIGVLRGAGVAAIVDVRRFPGSLRHPHFGSEEMGRWLAGEHPEITEPAHWTRQTCAAWVAAVDRMAVGDYSQSLAGKRGRVGEPLSPKTKSSYLRMARASRRTSGETRRTLSIWSTPQACLSPVS